MIELGESMFIETIYNELINLNNVIKIECKETKVDSKLPNVFKIGLYDTNEEYNVLGYIINDKELSDILSGYKKDKILTKEQCISYLKDKK